MELSPLGLKELKDLSRLMRQCSRGLEFAQGKALLENTFQDPDFDASYFLKALEKGTMIGAILGVARKTGLDGQKTGFIKYFGVLPKFRRRGAGQALFSELERRFQKRDVREIQIGACMPPYLQNGVECTDTDSVVFLLKRSYQRKGEVIDMTAPLSKWKPVEKDGDKALIKAYKIRRAKATDEALLMEMASAHFSGWTYEIKAGLRLGIVFLAEENGNLVAFCCGNAPNPTVFGPMGTLEAARGRGLARILHNKTLEAMKKAGAKSARIPWVGPIPFYAKFSGAKLGPIYWQFSKKV